MNNPATTTSEAIGIVQTSYTVSITFTAKPSDEQRRKLKASGFLFDKGRWYRNQSSSDHASQATVDQLLGA